MNSKKRKNNVLKYTRLIGLVLCMVMLVQLAGCGGAKKKKNTIISGNDILPLPSKPITEATKTDNGEIKIKGVLSGIDTATMKMRFVETGTGVEYSVPYSGGTDIRSRYDTILMVKNMELGEIYDVECLASGTASSIKVDKNSWERTNAANVRIDEQTSKVEIGPSNYTYDENALFFSDGLRIPPAQIVKQDELTVRGIDGKVYSVVVEKGHGYIRFSGVDAFEGGYVTLGDDQLYGVTKDMLVTAKEGTYDVELQNGSVVATKSVTVARGTQITMDFSEYLPPATNMGAVNFKITPSNAVMTIDGKEVNYSAPVSLEYGSHRLKLVANHYTEYTETIVVNSPYQTKVIDMTATGTAQGTTAADKTSGYTVKVTAPEGAALYVDSVYVGIIPCTFSKASGNKTITLSKSGYKTISYSISIANATGDLNYAFPAMVSESAGSATDTTETKGTQGTADTTKQAETKSAETKTAEKKTVSGN